MLYILFFYRLLYKQRYFEHVIGPLVDLFNSAENSTKQKALLAISSLLPSLPQLVLNAHIKRVRAFYIIF